jgi:glycosyltransferase involved in cell wall biosynthesis
LLPYTGFTSDSGVAALALSNQRPIIATNAGGLGELLRAAELGIAIQEDTVEAVEQALRKANERGRDDLRRLGRNGSDYVNKHRAWGAIAQLTRALYSGLAKERHQLANLSGEAAS